MTRDEHLFEVAAEMVYYKITLNEAAEYAKTLSDSDNAKFARMIIAVVHNGGVDGI